MPHVTSESISQLRLTQLVKKASVCSMDVSTATAVYNANSPRAGSHALRLGRLFDAMATAHYVCAWFDGRMMEDDCTDFSSVSEPEASASAPTAPSNEPGDGDGACSTLCGEMQPFLSPEIMVICYSGFP
jgi:hypothetical protein